MKLKLQAGNQETLAGSLDWSGANELYLCTEDAVLLSDCDASHSKQVSRRPAAPAWMDAVAGGNNNNNAGGRRSSAENNGGGAAAADARPRSSEGGGDAAPYNNNDASAFDNDDFGGGGFGGGGWENDNNDEDDVGGWAATDDVDASSPLSSGGQKGKGRRAAAATAEGDDDDDEDGNGNNKAAAAAPKAPRPPRNRHVRLKRALAGRASLAGDATGLRVTEEEEVDPDAPPGTVSRVRRRSARTKHRPLEWWRCERKEYGRPHRSLPTVRAVVSVFGFDVFSFFVCFASSKGEGRSKRFFFSLV